MNIIRAENIHLTELQQLAQLLNIYSPDGSETLFCAIENQQIVGFIGWQFILDEADLLVIGVLPEYQRQKIGFHLHQQTIPKALCTLEVRANNLKAQQFYQALGYQFIAKRKNYYGNEDAFIFQLDNRSENKSFME